MIKLTLPKNVSSLVLLSILSTLILPMFPPPAIAANPPLVTRVIRSFDSDWRFHQGETSGAEKTDLDDSAWRKLDVPHDWSIEGPFDKDNPTRGAGGFVPAGVGWYRKHFALQFNAMMQRVVIEFDGVMANSDVWINGFHLGRRPYGYVGFEYELTGHVNIGKQENVLVVRADNSGQPASRWYSGAGIYRHVRLAILPPLHIAHRGTFVTTPKITDQEATVHVRTTVSNQANDEQVFTLQTVIVAPNGELVSENDTQFLKVAP